jgi:predicted nucleic acid-binding protein
MAGPVIVPDASVLLKWVLASPDEEDRSPALALKAAWLEEAVDLVVPTLWVFEVGNVLGLKQRTGAAAMLQALIDLDLPEQPVSSYLHEIFKVMRAHDVTFYDAAYHALAISRDGTMLTADLRYCRKCARSGHLAPIGDWRP